MFRFIFSVALAGLTTGLFSCESPIETDGQNDEILIPNEQSSDYTLDGGDQIFNPQFSIGGRMNVLWPFGQSESMGALSGDEGERTNGVNGYFCGRYVSTHSGADYYSRDLTRSGAYGKPIYAGISGRVVVARDDGAYGKTVVIYDASRRVALRYAHLSSIGVSHNQWVNPGQYIGKVGNTGNVTGTHLHINGYENIDHFQGGDPVIPTLCDSNYYACAIYFYI